MTSPVWTVAAVVVGAILGGFAQVVAGEVEYRRRTKAEQVRLKREAYLDFLARAEALFTSTGYSQFASKVGRLHEDIPNAFRAEMAARYDLTVAQMAVEMYGPEGIQEQARTLVAALNLAREPGASDEESATRMSAFQLAHDRTLAGMRVDLE